MNHEEKCAVVPVQAVTVSGIYRREINIFQKNEYRLFVIPVPVRVRLLSTTKPWTSGNLFEILVDNWHRKSQIIVTKIFICSFFCLLRNFGKTRSRCLGSNLKVPQLFLPLYSKILVKIPDRLRLWLFCSP
jgi:hypothetical protein